MNKINALKELIEGKKKFVILTHKSPDGDALGSSIGWSRFLKSNYQVDVKIVYPDAFPKSFLWMFNEADCFTTFESDEELSKKYIDEAEAVFCLDFNALSRLGEQLESYVRSSVTPKVLIDHHPYPEDFPVISFSDTSMSSTSEFVFKIASEINPEAIQVDVMEACYVGISTDTGNFTYNSSNPQCFRIVADMMAKGLDKDSINKKIYGSNREQRLRLLGHILNDKLVILRPYKAAYISLTYQERQDFGYEKGDTEGFVNMVLDMEGIEFAIFVSENEENIRLSFRSKFHFNTNQFARTYFDGGGHVHASGGSSNLDMPQTLAKLEECIEKEKNEICK